MQSNYIMEDGFRVILPIFQTPPSSPSPYEWKGAILPTVLERGSIFFFGKKVALNKKGGVVLKKEAYHVSVPLFLRLNFQQWQ